MLTKGSRVDVQRASDISKRWPEQAREPAQHMRRRLLLAATVALLLSVVTGGVIASGPSASDLGAARAQQFPVVKLPPGLTIEKVVGGLTYPTAVTWDDDDRMYVTEAGGQFLEEPPPARILRIDGGRAVPLVNLTRGASPIQPPA